MMNFKISKKKQKKNNFYETLLLGGWGVNEDAVKSDAAAAVQSIPAYVREGKLGKRLESKEGFDKFGPYGSLWTLLNWTNLSEL